MTGEMSLLAAFVVGLLGGVHCVGMCGGIVSALSFGVPQEAQSSLARMFPFQLAYNAGRLTSYAVAGGIMGGLGLLLVQFLPVYYAQQVLYVLAGLFMVLLGLYLGGWWMGLSGVERLGGVLWRRIEPYGRHLLPVRRPRQAFYLGLLWGWLPCGLVYSVLVWAVSAGAVWRGAALLLAFGLGTLPNLLAMGVLVGGLARWVGNPWVRRLAGLAVVGFGVYALWQALGA
jgi:sulfite exporter TauE/SafE